jgi:hypothetical protein
VLISKRDTDSKSMWGRGAGGLRPSEKSWSGRQLWSGTCMQSFCLPAIGMGSRFHCLL